MIRACFAGLKPAAGVKLAGILSVLAGAGISAGQPAHAQGTGKTAVYPAGATVDLGPTISTVRDGFHAPAIAAAAIRDGRLIATGSVGVRSLESNEPIRPDDRFLIGSCAKAMLRLLIARQIDQGKLSYESTLGDLLKDIPMRDEYREVTIAQLLSFRGGIQPYTRIGPKFTPWLFELTGSPTDQRAAFARHVLNEPPVVPPGSEMVYSNAAYGIAAHIAERLAGKPWEELVAQEVFGPLGMTSAIVGSPTTDENKNGPAGHVRDEDGFRPVSRPRQPLAPFSPAGMISCTIDDFARFAGKLALLQKGDAGGYLSEVTRAESEKLDPGGADAVPFFGGEGSFTAAYATWPRLGLAIVIETNGGDSDDVCAAALEAVRALVAPGAKPVPKIAIEPDGGPGPGPGPGPAGGPRRPPR
jgi:CubicO group peptidase (beta-lactamase class C family)